MRALHIAVKDMKVWLRDVAAMGILLGMPLILILILGSALGGGGSSAGIRVAVVNLDAGWTGPIPGAALTSSQGMTVNLGDELVDTLKRSKRISETFDIEYGSADEQARVDEVAAGDLAAVLVIPRDFSLKTRTGEPTELKVITDPGAELSAGIWVDVVDSFAVNYSAASVAVQTVVTEARRYGVALGDPRELGRIEQAAVQAAAHDAGKAVVVSQRDANVSKGLSALDYYAVSMSAMFLMFGAMFGAFSTIKERREQTLSRLLSTPIGAATVTGGKMLGIFVLGMVQFTVLYLATRFIFGVDWGASVLATYLVAAAEMLAVTGLAVLIASIARTERGAGGIGPLVIQIQALLGGAFFAITILPAWMQPVRYLSVVGWALEGWHAVQLRGAGVGEVLGPIAALAGFAVVFFAVGSALMGARR